MNTDKAKLPLNEFRRRIPSPPAGAARRRCAAAFTLVEVIVAMAVLAIGAIGALGYQYHATKQARVARAQITATRIGQLLLEDWKSTGGSDQYDPTALELGFQATAEHVSEFIYGQDMGTALRGTVYAISVDDVPIKIVLKWQDVDTDTVAQITLRQLAVILKFDEPSNVSGSLAAYNPAILLTTYVRVDASGG